MRRIQHLFEPLAPFPAWQCWLQLLAESFQAIRNIYHQFDKFKSDTCEVNEQIKGQRLLLPLTAAI